MSANSFQFQSPQSKTDIGETEVLEDLYTCLWYMKQLWQQADPS